MNVKQELIAHDTSGYCTTCLCGAVLVTIYGNPQSKANSRQAVVIRGRPSFIKSKAALAYAKLFTDQCPVLAEPLTQDVAVHIKIYYSSRRPDLDDSLILDLLQGRVYANDRQVKQRHIYHGLDRDCPRSIILVRPMETCDCNGVGRCLLKESGLTQGNV